MKIPKENDKREEFYWELIGKCGYSAADRKPQYSRLRNNFLFGSTEGTPVPFNKIYPHIDLLTSFLFSIDTTRFSIDLDADADKEEINKLKCEDVIYPDVDTIDNNCLK